MQRIEFGKYIVADPNICHGSLTFKGTRIFVQDVIEMVAVGMDWDAIIAEWDNVINREAIAEAVRLAGKALELIQAGISFDKIVTEYYPDVTIDDIKVCVQYAID